MHSFHEHSELNFLSNIFVSKLKQGQKECDRYVYAQLMLRYNMGVDKSGDFIHEITPPHKMLWNYVIFVVSWCLCTVEKIKKILKTISIEHLLSDRILAWLFHGIPCQRLLVLYPKFRAISAPKIWIQVRNGFVVFGSLIWTMSCSASYNFFSFLPLLNIFMSK